jgi:hypothetical protein
MGNHVAVSRDAHATVNAGLDLEGIAVSQIAGSEARR